MVEEVVLLRVCGGDVWEKSCVTESVCGGDVW